MPRRLLRLLVIAVVGLTASGCSSGGGSPSLNSPASTVTSPGGESPSASGATPTPATTSTAPAPPAHLTAAIVGPTLPQPISRAVAVPRGDAVVLLGGRTTAKVSTADVVTWKPQGSVAVTGSLARRVHDSSVAVVDGHTLVFGGGDGGSVAEVQEVDAADHGTEVGQLPIGRSDLSAVTVDGRAYVLGGFDDRAGVVAILATTDGQTLERVADLPGEIRYGAAVGLGHEVLMFGGEDQGGPSDAVLALDPKDGTVKAVATLPVKLSHASAFVLGGQAYVAGGRTGDTRHTEIWRYDPGPATFTQVGDLPGPRSDAAVAVVGDIAYFLGGETPATVDTVVAVKPA